MTDPASKKAAMQPQPHVSPTAAAKHEAEKHRDDGSVVVESKHDNSVVVTINGKTYYRKDAVGNIRIGDSSIAIGGASGQGVARSLVQSTSVADATTLDIHADYGTIAVTASRKEDDIRITAKVTLDDIRLNTAERKKFIDRFVLTIEKDGDTLSPRVVAPKDFPHDIGFAVSYEASVPRNVALKVSSDHGDVSVKDTHTEASVVATSSYGDIMVAHAGNEITAKSQNGDVKITCDPGTVNIEATSNYGDVAVSGDAKTVQASSQNGNVAVKGAKHALWVQAETSYGEVEIEDCGGGITGNSQNGNVSFSGAPKKLDLASSYGEVSATIASADSLTNATLDSSSGDVEVELPASARVAVDAEAISGNIDLDGAAGSVDEDGSRETYQQSLNGGSAPLQLRTSYGDVTIRVR